MPLGVTMIASLAGAPLSSKHLSMVLWPSKLNANHFGHNVGKGRGHG